MANEWVLIVSYNSVYLIDELFRSKCTMIFVLLTTTYHIRDFLTIEFFDLISILHTLNTYL